MPLRSTIVAVRACPAKYEPARLPTAGVNCEVAYTLPVADSRTKGKGNEVPDTETGAELTGAPLVGITVLGDEVLGVDVKGEDVLGETVLGINVVGPADVGETVVGAVVVGDAVNGEFVAGDAVVGVVVGTSVKPACCAREKSHL